jgi:hypothetical protein
MCGPTKAQKDLNGQIQDLNTQIASEAKQLNITDTSTFNNLMKQYNDLVVGGPSQQGFSQDTINRMNTQIIENTAASARNARAAVASDRSAIGGGNVSLPSGAGGAETAAIANATEAAKNRALAGVQLESEKQGRENYFAGLSGERQAPDIFNNLTAFNNESVQANKEAQTSQQNMVTQGRWWQKDIMGALGGGFGNLDTTGGSTGGEQGMNFLTGMLGI